MEMEEERIATVLLRASELRTKIAYCISKTTAIEANPVEEGSSNVANGVDENSTSKDKSGEVDDDEEAEILFDICGAFDSLESHLISFQALLQQQQYERETLIREIDYSRNVLLTKLAKYEGDSMDVIREAEAFASMKVEEHDHELVLPPSPTPTPHSLVSDGSPSENGCSNGIDFRHEQNNSPSQCRPSNLWGGLIFLVRSTAKTMLTLEGLIFLLNLAGYEPRLGKKGAHLKVLNLFQRPDSERKRASAKCPPGKVAVIEAGETRCVVKERVEIPFDSIGDNPRVNYGWG